AYNYSFFGTEVDFRFNSIYVGELDEIELSRSDNPFAKILLITKLAIQKIFLLRICLRKRNY
ncbi:MAG: hypothetical protein J7497_12565, partial [Chitinophagaceae bacterium]|nr:hypothetical protein [Chitinophagaceae bacterium]